MILLKTLMQHLCILGRHSWRCLDSRTCNGRLITEDDYTDPMVTRPHNHQPNPDKVLVRKVRTAVRRRAAEETTPLPAIYQQETAQLANNSAAAAMMPSYNDVATSMHRDRLSQYPPLPRTGQRIVLPQAFQTTTTGQQFFLSRGKTIIIKCL